jgi:hypothetical protein
MIEVADPRERAFNALIPIAPTVSDVLKHVRGLVVEDDRRNAAARAGWTHPQRASTSGYARFCWTVEGLRVAFSRLDSVSYASTPAQETRNLFLWQVAPRLTFRVKREPSDIVGMGPPQLFSIAPSEADSTVCLAWSTRLNRQIDNVRFVNTHGDPWSITLAELLIADQASNVAPMRLPRARVRSARITEVSASTDGQGDLGDIAD